jgi:signal transduction histidine kinase
MTAVARSAGLARTYPPRTVAIAAAALLAGIAGFVLVTTSDHFPDRELWALFGPLVGWSWVGAGLYASHRRPESRLGTLMTVLGFAWFLTTLSAADSSLLFTAGFALGALWGPLLAHLLLSFPSGRLPSGGRRTLVAAGYVLAPLVPVPAMLVSESAELTDCDGPCPENLLLVSHDAELGETLWGAGSAVLMTLCLLVVALLVSRWRHAGPSERRSLAPLLGAGAVTLLFVFGFAATQAQALITLAFLAFAATPLAFLAGLLRADFSQARGVRSLVARLAELPAPGDLRDALARALGDETLSVAYWVPEQARYVDEAGGAVALPAADDADRAVTEIERDGRRIAAIVHDPALVEDRETVRAAGAATTLLLENQRLDAELRARMEELRASRQRLVQAGDAERRRLERDLHDGAQSRLVALALNLRLAHGRMDGDSEAAALIDASIDELKLSLEELRELAHGIHPAVLSERGLAPAVRALAARAPVPVALEGSPGERLPAAVETAAYFVVSEGLTNVAKYAQAAHATVRMQRVDGRLVLEVSDDGIGGAAPSVGSGLHGLSDRVAALDGSLEVASPPGGGTRLRVELPCA